MLASSRHIAVKYVLPLYYTREDIEQVFDITKGYAKALPLNVQSIDTFRGHLLMVFISTIILRLFQRTLAKPPYSLDDVMSVIRNQKSKVFDEFVISTEPTKKQNELYKLVGVKPELSITRQGREDVRNFGSKDIIGASNPGLYHDHENNQYQHETQIS